MVWLTAWNGSDAGGVPLGTLLDDVTQKAVAEINVRFLALCIAPRPRPDQRFDLAEAIFTRIGLAESAVLERVAACPFTLFDLRLLEALNGSRPDEGDGTVRERAMPYPLESKDPDVPLFIQQALFLAWHFASTAPMACRLALGFTPAAEQALRGLSPARLGDLCTAPHLIRPRWPYNLRFWTTLLDAAQADSKSLLRRGHCLGIQLLAADLCGRQALDARRPRSR